jgi:hypothetical protein
MSRVAHSTCPKGHDGVVGKTFDTVTLILEFLKACCKKKHREAELPVYNKRLKKIKTFLKQ